MVMGDRGYTDQNGPWLTPKTGNAYRDDPDAEAFNADLQQTRALVEQVNSRIKNFKCLSTVWRHGYDFLEPVFHVICKMINMDLTLHPITAVITDQEA